jgi:hypothetical protein
MDRLAEGRPPCKERSFALVSIASLHCLRCEDAVLAAVRRETPHSALHHIRFRAFRLLPQQANEPAQAALSERTTRPVLAYWQRTQPPAGWRQTTVRGKKPRAVEEADVYRSFW